MTSMSMVEAARLALAEEMRRKFDDAERRIVRLPPSAFPQLPAPVVRELQVRGCAIHRSPTPRSRTT